MPAKSANLEAAIQELERALDENVSDSRPQRAESLEKILANLEATIREHVAALRPADGCLVKVDRPRLPSPTVDRRAEQLCQELESFGGEVQALLQKAQAIRQSDGPGANVSWQVLDYAGLSRRAKELVEVVNQFQRDEADLILESVNTDIGAGD